jgi:ATP-dependent Clp protease adaptor protein ClpS
MSEDIEVQETTKIKVTEPNEYKVVFLNDDSTPMDFVVMLIVELFKHTHDTAHDLTMQIHEEGSGVVGVFSHEIAEQKALESTSMCRDNGFPLKVKIEENL